APPYDVIAPPARAALAGQSPHNIVHVILPEGNGDRYRNAAGRLADWRRQGVLVRDTEPALYVVQQSFETSSSQRHVRTGVIGALSVEPYSAGRVKPHERTHAGPKADRLELLRATKAMFEALFLLARDRGQGLRHRLQGITQTPPTSRAVLDGVTISMW